MSERIDSKGELRNRKALRTIGVITTAAAFWGAGVGTHAEFFQSEDKQAGLSQSELQRKLIETSQHETIAHELAVQQAAYYTKAINEALKAPRHSVPIKILNGTVETISTSKDGTKGKPIPIYRDPIFLTVFDETLKPDPRGEFLQGGWIGIKSNDSTGKVIIRPVPYYIDTSANTFVADDPEHIVMSVNAYAVTNKGGPGYAFYDLYAADPLTNKALKHSDGSPVQPGQPLVGAKGGG